jgi:SET domain-containing protein
MDAPLKRTKRKIVEVRRSPIQGRGLYALVDIAKGERIIEYLGERLSNEATDARYADDDALERHHTFLFTVNDNEVIDATRRGNAARYINHSCDPNCESVIEEGRIFIHASKKIRAGTELSYDYWYTTDESYTDEDLVRIYPCRCGSPRCRGTLAAPREPQTQVRARRPARSRGRRRSSS